MGTQSTIYPKEVFMNDPRYAQTLAELLLYLHKRYVFIPKQITDTDNQYEEIKDIEYCYWSTMKFTVIDKEFKTHTVYVSENDIYAIESGLFSFLMCKNMIDFDRIDTKSFFFNEETPIRGDDRDFDYPEVNNQEPEFWAMYMAFQNPVDRFDKLKWLLNFSVL